MEKKPKLLIVDDDAGILKQLKWALEDEYDIITASNKEQALRSAKEHEPDIIALDVNLDSVDPESRGGIDVLEGIKNEKLSAKVIMITGNDSKEIALEAISKGAFDYYVKPVDAEELKVILRRALYILDLEKENLRLHEELENKIKFEDMIGTSSKMEEVFGLIKKVAPSDATVLITGESGTGKELVARAIHYLSPRESKPFIVINCGAIPENLLESELFGHEKGAFTDAYVQRKGKLESADKGTVFLDEIGEMSLGLQVKILRFLQEKVIERVGGNAPISLDVRIIAATNQNLQVKIKDGEFRDDLYYRLSVINIGLPPLRERGEDVIMLADYFLNRYKNEAHGKEVKGFNKEAKDAMRKYSWPGNVREMDNKVRRAVILARNPLITPEDMGLENGIARDGQDKGKLSLKEARYNFEKELIQKAISESNGNLSLAAKMLGVTRPTLYDLMKKYGLQDGKTKDS